MLRRLVELIVELQRDFFVGGPEHLKPATLRAAAEVLGVHPATVSRAISGKYIETPNGIFPLKFFFQSGTEDVSRASIKEKIRAMIEAEDKRSPLSDDEIAVRLKTEGIEISRRTIAKYRSEMGIPGSSERKSF
jgi:RNA polymerase sigma-54 factor